jgi:GTPase
MSSIPNAVLVGIQLPKTSAEDLDNSLNELSRLVKTLGYNVVGQVTQKRSTDRSMSILGEGKLKELAEWTGGGGEIASLVQRKLTKAKAKWLADASDTDSETETATDTDTALALDSAAPALPDDKRGSAQIVIVDTDLSPSQIRNLESAVGVTVLDRTGVIIEIFSRHAKTRAARIQVEIARLQYVAPRLREAGGGDDSQGGGGRGASETKLELDRRKIRDRVKELKTELASIGNEHQVRRARRQQELTVALVGYTNAGKSSLMRAMTGSEVLVADKLFATLDTTIRPMHPETRPKVLMSDTVGFIKKLPHDLVASFKSTLDEALHASLLLFIVDASDPSFRSQLEVTRGVLSEVGADEIPRLLILNKRDRLDENQASELRTEFPESVMISTRNKEDLQMLRDKIMSYFETDMSDEDIFVPYSVQGVIGDIRAKMRVLGESYNELGVTMTVRATSEALTQIKKRLTRG